MKKTELNLMPQRPISRPMMYVDQYGPRVERMPHQMTLLDLDFVQIRGLLPLATPHPVKQPVFPDPQIFDAFRKKCDF